MTWHVEVSRTAERELSRLPDSILRRVTRKLVDLGNHPFPRGFKKLTGGGYRLRIGDYRVLYQVDRGQRRIVIYAVGHRRDVYR